MKTILYVHHSTELYGSDKMLLILASGLDRARFQPLVVLPGVGKLTEALEKRGIPTLTLPLAKISRSLFTPAGLAGHPVRLAASLLALERALKRRRIDIVHSNTLAVSSGAVWARRHRIPHVWHVHEIIEHPAAVRKGLAWMLWLLADRVAVTSHAVGRFWITGRPGLENKTTVIWNGLSEGRRAQDAAVRDFRHKIGAGAGVVIIALVGRINRWKGQLLFVRAAEILAEMGVKKVIFLMVGDPPPGQTHYRDNLQARIDASPVKDRLKVVGFMEDIRVVWDACDLAVVPSTEPEPFGIVALEAMAAARPVVAANHGGLPEIVSHAKTGLLFRPGTAADLAAKLAWLIGDEARRERYGAAGYNRFKAEFTADGFVRSFEHLYDAMSEKAVP